MQFVLLEKLVSSDLTLHKMTLVEFTFYIFQYLFGCCSSAVKP